MKTGYLLVFALGLLWFSSCKKDEDKTFSVSGRILDANTSAPIANAQVSIDGGLAGSLPTDANGYYQILNVNNNVSRHALAIICGDHWTENTYYLPDKKNITGFDIKLYPTAYIDFEITLVDTTCDYITFSKQYGRYFRRSATVYRSGPTTAHLMIPVQPFTVNDIYLDTERHLSGTSDYKSEHYQVNCPSDTTHYFIHY